MDDLDGLFVGYIAVETADGGAAQPQAGDFETAAAEEMAALARAIRWSISVPTLWLLKR